eukprot:m.174207 g.174207  ORF g.174207 m.174207 type:complete len:143 (+) comp18326_c0_seq5:413-841(+)
MTSTESLSSTMHSPKAKEYKRSCFQMKFSTENLPQYLFDHETVWPEMQQALVDCGWYDYSLFYRDDGFAVGVFRTDTSGFDEACARMDKTTINAKWQSVMSKYTPANVVPIDAAKELALVTFIGVCILSCKPLSLFQNLHCA